MALSRSGRWRRGTIEVWVVELLSIVVPVEVPIVVSIVVPVVVPIEAVDSVALHVGSKSIIVHRRGLHVWRWTRHCC